MANKIMINCCKCKETKDAEEFFADKKGPHGRMRRCKDCDRKQKQAYYNKTKGSKKTMNVPPEIASTELDIDFLADFKRPSKLGWPLPQIKLLLVKVQEAKEAGVTNYDKIFKIYGGGRAKSSCINVITEIKKLAIHNRELAAKGEEKISLETYWAGKREFKLGNQIAADSEPEKNGKKRKK